VTYTGYTAEQLAEGDDPAWPALIAATDLLVAGPYIAGLARPDLLKGSSNQQAIFLGTKIPVSQETAHPDPARRRTEFTIAPDGTITTTGFPVSSLIGQLASRCRGA
jgi:anaerobic ribonucleoside-triphosphate reductase activating protein